jgi:hypothetical protein
MGKSCIRLALLPSVLLGTKVLNLPTMEGYGFAEFASQGEMNVLI